MIDLEKFSGFWGKLLPSDFTARLDRNFQKLNDVQRIKATTLAAFTFRANDTTESLQVDATTAASTIYLPDQPTGQQRRRITKTDASANAVTVNGNGNLINGAATYVLAARYNSVEVEPDGTGWLITDSR